MLKYLSVVCFAVVLSWTWAVINSEAAISLETHVGIQNRLSNLIRESILTKIPAASNITILDLWTEPTSTADRTQITAHFAYRYTQPGETPQGTVTSELAGNALMELQPDDGSGVEKWTLKEFKSSSDAISFNEPLVIATGETAPVPATVPSAPETQKQEAQ